MIAIAGAAAVSPLGLAWRGLSRAVLAPSPSSELAATHPGTLALEVSPIADTADARQLKLMSRAARLAAVACREALRDAGWPRPHDEVGHFLGVGASGGPIGDLELVLRHGMNASNPLSTFQLLNNFTLCHAAILEGTGGPSGAFYSRGSGTVAALMEAAHAISDGDCARALAGGADSALHPVTFAELRRDGFAGIPSEGAALLALEAAAAKPLAFLESCALGRIPDGKFDLVVNAADITAALGDSLAAAPALAWMVALDFLQSQPTARVLCVSAGPDLGAVVLAGAKI